MLLYTGTSERRLPGKAAAPGRQCTPPPGASPEATDRLFAASSTEARLITERPRTFSTLSYASAAYMPSCRFPVPVRSWGSDFQADSPAAACSGSLQALHACHRYGSEQACAPLEPLLGGAVLAVPGHSGFVVYGGRAATEHTQDLPECVQRLVQWSSFRFQYHAELEAAVPVVVGNDTARALLLVCTCLLLVCTGLAVRIALAAQRPICMRSVPTCKSAGRAGRQ